MFLYSIFIDEIIVRNELDLIVAVGILFSVGVIAGRLIAYGYTKDSDSEKKFNEEIRDQIKENIHNGIYGAIISLWFLLLIGIGVTIFEQTPISGSIWPSASPIEGIILTTGFFFIIFLISVISEALLWLGPLDVPSHLSD
ncbi:hypothetical protein [Halorubrum distributum]|uniref:hypothetical protein n=1 Tax=Halorubrum distributum TaxID=29283 RepID=UPI001331507C|nr:hypothetical protein [Halorubrum terrestre]